MKIFLEKGSFSILKPTMEYPFFMEVPVPGIHPLSMLTTWFQNNNILQMIFDFLYHLFLDQTYQCCLAFPATCPLLWIK